MLETKKRNPLLLILLVLVLLLTLASVLSRSHHREKPPTPAPIASPSPPPIRNDENRRLLAQVPKKDEKFRRPYLQELLALKEKDGRDNAMIHYVVAGWSMPNVPSESTLDTTITSVLKNGWNAKADCLRPYLKAWQPGFREIRKGVGLNYARGVGFEEGWQTPVPDWLATQRSAKALCVEGCLFESEKRYSDAMDDYLTALGMGHDFTSAGNILISYLIGIAGENQALKRINLLAASGNLDASALDHLLARLKQIEKTHGSGNDAMASEIGIRELKSFFTLIRKDPGRWFDQNGGVEMVTLWDVAVAHDKRAWDGFVRYEVKRYRMTHGLDQAEKDLKDISDLGTQFLRASWWETDVDKYERETEIRYTRSPILLRISLPSFVEVKVRFTFTQTFLRGCQLSTSIGSWKKKHSAPPPTLQELRAEYFPNGVPIDPFSGKGFVYSPSKENQYRLASTGPDKKADSDGISYDPTNGTII